MRYRLEEYIEIKSLALKLNQGFNVHFLILCLDLKTYVSINTIHDAI